MSARTALSEPDCRIGVIAALAVLADVQPQDAEAIGQAIGFLFDETELLPEPRHAVGACLYPNETGVLLRLGAYLVGLLSGRETVGEAYYGYALRPRIVGAAAEAVTLMQSADHG